MILNIQETGIDFDFQLYFLWKKKKR